MALPDFDDLKAYLRVTTTVEDSLIEDILASAQAWLAGYYRVPLDSQTRTFQGLWPKMGVQRVWNTRLIVPIHPCADSGTLSDSDGETVDANTYYIDPRSGFVEAKKSVTFSNPPYGIEVSVGWEEHPDFTDLVEPVLRQGILWAGATYYRNRNPGAIYEQSGGQVSITYTPDEIPPLLRSQLAAIKDSVWFGR